MQNKKIFIYQIFTRLFGNNNPNKVFNGTIEENGSGKLQDISDKAIKAIVKNGYTHIWLTGILAHSSTTDYTAYGIPKEYPEIIKGKAGSPYAIRDYYDINPDLAVGVKKRMFEFEELIERIHKNELKVIIDFVPNHLSRNYKSINKPADVEDFGEQDDNTKAFSHSNNFYYLPGQALEIQFANNSQKETAYTEYPAKATGNDCFTNKPTLHDWYETVKLNYGIDYQNGYVKHFEKIPDTWIKMRDILIYWAGKNVDGFRCDMAEMVPIEFWRWAIPQVKAKYPELLFIAEVYNPNEYRNFLHNNCFNYLYDKVGVYDIVRDVACGYRDAHEITNTLNSVGDIQHKMLNFMENHDEQRIASDYFLKSGKNGLGAMIFTACLNTNPVMVYFGQEFGEKGMEEEGFSGRNGRTTIFDYWSLDCIRRWNNNGKWNDELLTGEELALKNIYSKLINLCNKENALAKGLFYNIMYANSENPNFNSSRQFAFLRSDKKDLLLIVINFDNKETTTTVYIPEDALRFFELPVSENYRAEGLLFQNNPKIEFSYHQPFCATIDANSGEIFKIRVH